MDGNGPQGRDPGGEQAEEDHHRDSPTEHEWIARGALVGDKGEQIAANGSQGQAHNRTERQQPKGSTQSGLQDVPTLRTKGDADTKLLKATADSIGSHTEDTREGKHGPEST